MESMARTASRIDARDASVSWDPARNVELLSTFLARRCGVEGTTRPDRERPRERAWHSSSC